jgi:hypothetical protein
MLSKISSMLDDIANSLQKKGLIKEAYEIDKIADEFDDPKNWSGNDPRWQTMPTEKYNELVMPQVVRYVSDPEEIKAVKKIITNLGMDEILTVGDSSSSKLHKGPNRPALLRLRHTSQEDSSKMKRFWEETKKLGLLQT